MRYFLLVMLVFVVASCKKEPAYKERSFSSVKIKTVLQDSTLSIRAIDILDDGNLAFAANNNTFGLYYDAEDKLFVSQQQHDSLDIHFRSVASTSNDFFMLSIANPALLFKTGKQNAMNLVYKEVHEKVFYDALAFWNDNEGLAIGDTTDDCLSIIITRDGGNTWKKIACDQLPKSENNEGAFAASNTNIAIVGDKTWVATTAGRILYSEDKGATWQVYNTPIVKEKDTEGIYSIDFYDANNGFAIGGDYTKPEANVSNKMRTVDGGKIWELVAKGAEPGYRSCVQYVPNSFGKELVAVGFNGIDFSNDNGTTWKHLTDEGFYTIRFLNDSTAFAAGQGRISKLLFSE